MQLRWGHLQNMGSCQTCVTAGVCEHGVQRGQQLLGSAGRRPRVEFDSMAVGKEQARWHRERCHTGETNVSIHV